MGSERDEATILRPALSARPGRLPWPAAVRAILWMDAVVLAGLALAAGGKLPALGYDAGLWTWTASAGSTLTTVLAALSAFELTAPGRSRLWGWLPVPGFVLWIGASGLGCLALPSDTNAWGDTLAEAGECLAFLLKISAPLLALVHPHDAALLDLGAHAIAIALVLAAGAVAARLARGAPAVSRQ